MKVFTRSVITKRKDVSRRCNQALKSIINLKSIVHASTDSDQTEYDYQYGGEEKEDSDTESGSNSRNAK